MKRNDEIARMGRYWVLGTRYWVLGTGYWVQGTGYWKNEKEVILIFNYEKT